MINAGALCAEHDRTVMGRADTSAAAEQALHCGGILASRVEAATLDGQQQHILAAIEHTTQRNAAGYFARAVCGLSSRPAKPRSTGRSVR